MLTKKRKSTLLTLSILMGLTSCTQASEVIQTGNRDHRVRSKAGNDLAVHHQINLFRVIGCNFDITCHDRFLLS